MRRNFALAVLLATELSCTGSADTPTSGRDRWFEVASATGSVPAGAPATTECRWDLPCDLVRTDAFETRSAPIRLVCEGDATYLFVEYHPGPEPWSGNTHICSGDGPSGIFLVPDAEIGLYLYGVSRVRPNVPLEWTVSVQVWHGRWVEPDCANRSTRRPRGAWETCGEGPTGFALPAPTPSDS